MKSHENIHRRLELLSPMLSECMLNSYGKYDIAEAQMEAFTYDEREALNI